jgi:formate hydrogenlyase subunit 3/multisubunit Na+/H+ antiporter MnhD subunit
MSGKYITLRIVAGIIAVVGFLIIFGTAGADDLGRISSEQSLLQSAIGLVLFVVGALVAGVDHEG